MPVLYVLRHAKANPGTTGGNDAERPLSESGLADARALGERIPELDLAPDLVLCSTARRARETLAQLLPHLPGELSVQIEDIVYEGDDAHLVARLRAVPSHHRRVMLVGHNPALERLTRQLSADGAPTALRRLDTKFPPGALAEIAFTMEAWSDLQPGAGRLVRLIEPAR